MPLTLCLLLLLLFQGAAATATLTLGDSFPDPENKRQDKGPLTFLAWRNEWISQASAVPFGDKEAKVVAKRQDVPPPQQATRQEKAPCKNFFWKTFSSCK
ncbi:cortistatin-like [Rhynchocyon petersi]